MRSKVLSPLHRIRRHVDMILSKLLPSHAVSQLSLTNPFPGQPVRGWNSLYEMVTFRPDIGYAAALRTERYQKAVVEWIGLLGSGVGLGAVGMGVWAAWGAFKRSPRF